MQCQAPDLRATCGQFGECAARTGTESRAEGTRAHATNHFQSCAFRTFSGHSLLNPRRFLYTKGTRGVWRHGTDWFQLRDTGLALERPDINSIKLRRRVAAAVQPGGSGAAPDDFSSPEDVSSSKEAVKESSGAAGWVRRKWAENRAEYERLRGVLKDLGLAGFLSYGLFNTGYYLVSFLFVWFFVSPSPGGLGVSPAAKRFIKIFAMVWAGSQVTKLLRAGGALLLAPLVDRGLDWFTAKGRFRSKTQAFWAIVGSCIALALVIFVVIVSLWA